jgi:hypothetical protein
MPLRKKLLPYVEVLSVKCQHISICQPVTLDDVGVKSAIIRSYNEKM